MFTVKKMLATFGFLCIAVLLVASPAYARDLLESANIEIQPFWSHTSTINVNLNINNSGRATMTGMVVGNSGTTHISVNATLERINPNGTATTVATFNNIRQEGSWWVWERPHYVARGHDYRLTLTSTVFRNGQSETLSHSSRVVRAN